MKRWLLGIGSALAPSALLAGGCSSQSEPDKYPTTSSFAQAIAAAECARVSDDCGIDSKGCETKRSLYWQREADQRTNSGRRYTPGRAEECVNAWRDAHSDGKLTLDELDPSRAASAVARCERAFQGTRDQFQTCASDFECSGDLVCTPVGAATTGASRVCAARSEVKLDQACANPGDVCEKGAYCAQVGAVAKCIGRRTRDQICDGTTAPCGEDLLCEPSGRICRDRFPAGAVCSANGECAAATPLCVIVDGEKRCTPMLKFGTGSPVCQAYDKNRP